MASIVILNDDSLYDNYVITTKKGDLALYVDVLVTKYDKSNRTSC